MVVAEGAPATVASERIASVAARTCAHAALDRLGRPSATIPRGRHGEPLWPAGVVGSISHCRSWHGACTALAADVAAIGIDVELHRPLPAGAPAALYSARERGRLDDLVVDAPGRHWATVAFSAKESVYKAWFPHHGSWLGFRDVEVTLQPGQDPGHGAVRARLVRPVGRIRPGDPGTRFEGSYLITDELVATSIYLPAAPLAPSTQPSRS